MSNADHPLTKAGMDLDALISRLGGDADEACGRGADLGSGVRAFADALATVQTPEISR